MASVYQVEDNSEGATGTEIESSSIEAQPSLGLTEDKDGIDESDNDDVEDLSDGDDEVDEDVIRGRQKLNSVATISSLRMKPVALSRFLIPLSRMVPMPMVRSTLQSDLEKLEQEFVHKYREGAAVFYVTTTNEGGCT